MQSTLLVRVPLWNATALAVSGTLTSPGIDLRRIDEITALICTFTSVLGAANVQVQYAVSEDNVTYGAFTDNPSIVNASTTDFPTPEGLSAVPGPAIKSSYIKIKLTELTGSVTDTLVSVVVLVREK